MREYLLENEPNTPILCVGQKRQKRVINEKLLSYQISTDN